MPHTLTREPRPALSSEAGAPAARARLAPHDLGVVLALTAVAAALRLLGLGQESIWYDEAYSLGMAGARPLDLVTGRAADPGNPAGYYLLLGVWLDLLGTRSIEAARALSGVAGALAVPAVWLLARTLGVDRRTGWLACFLVAISPPLVYLGQEARVFALFATVSTLALTAVVYIERHDTKRAWLAFVAAGVALVHLHYYGFLVLTVLGAYLLVWAWRRGRGERGRALLRLAGASAAVALGFAPYLPTFLWQLRQGAARSGDTWWQQLALMPSFALVGRTLVWKRDGLWAVSACSLAVDAAVYLPLAWVLVRTRAWPRTLPAFVLGLPALVGLVCLRVPLANCHYLSAVFPALLLLLACGLAAARARGGPGLWVPALALAVLLPASLARTYFVRHKTDWRAVAARVAEQGPDLPVYFYEDIGEDPFAYYRPGQPRYRLHEPFGADGAGWDQAGYTGRMRGEHNGFWVVLYLTSRRTMAQEEAIVERLGRDHVLVEEVTWGANPTLRLLRCRPAGQFARGQGGE